MYQTLQVEAVQDSGRQAIRFDIGSNAAILDVQDIDLLIERLGHIRSGLLPALPQEPSRTHNYVIEIDPCWYLDKNPLFDGVVLLLRHTGLGWAGFAIPQSSLERLQDAIVKPVPQRFEVSQIPS
ncbi:hypothetical protein [Caballeronia sp. 15715]|jgi:hypothetical protein|uniref:hypothetical protein n=1 Tax=unclassified Caballeronia TaxID=2646786 RepID=UPI0039E6C66D